MRKFVYPMLALMMVIGLVVPTIVAYAGSPHKVTFETSGLPSGISITVSGSYANNGGHTSDYYRTFVSPMSSGALHTRPNSEFTCSFPTSVTVGASTYTLYSVSPASDFMTGASGGETTVTATYREDGNIPG
jgi:hypothetical protein